MKLVAILTPNKDVEIYGVAQIFYDDSEKIYKYKSISVGKHATHEHKSRTLANLVKKIKTYSFCEIKQKLTAWGKCGYSVTVGATLEMIEGA